MSVSVPSNQSFESGFTLIEMLVVVLILSLTATVALPLFSGGSDSLRLQAASSELAAALRATRSSAIVRNAALTLMVDVERRTIQSPVVSQRPFARDIDAKLTFAKGVQSVRSDGGFRFFPDGSSTGGEVMLSLHGKQARICVDWLTGTIRQERAC